MLTKLINSAVSAVTKSQMDDEILTSFCNFLYLHWQFDEATTTWHLCFLVCR